METINNSPLSGRSLVWIAATFVCVTLASYTYAQELTQVLNPPATGTFFLLSGQTEEGTSPPYPFDPYQGAIPVYQAAGFGGAFLVADTAEDYALYQAVMRGRRLSLYQAAWGDGGMVLMSGEEGPPAPPGDGEGGEEWGGSEFTPMVFGSNDLWLEITNYADGAAAFIIHTPESAAYDLLGTSNLNLAVSPPALNGTNWLWLWRTEVAETNLVITNLWADMGFFRLGTLLDSDADGLTDAYELLVSHTNPNLWDTDGDGLGDGWELAHGMNPLVDESAQTSGRLNYGYDGSGWLRTVTGALSESITLDNEGNVQGLP